MDIELSGILGVGPMAETAGARTGRSNSCEGGDEGGASRLSRLASEMWVRWRGGLGALGGPRPT
jgi:hypothetical protein